MEKQIKGTELFVKALKEEGVDTLFAYPGGFAIDLFDAIYNQEGLEVILPRHEQGLIHAADGYARSTGKPGVCLVTSGPGATNLITGIATANFDSVPMVCFTGQVPTNLIGNDAFQEVDIVGITRSICKHGVVVRKREDLGRIIKEAFHIAVTGRPGPVIVDLPKDIQLALGDDSYPEDVSIRSYKPSQGVHKGQIKKAAAAMQEAVKPLFLLGGGVRISGAGTEMEQLLNQTGIPAVTTIMGKGCVPTNHPLYFGNMGMHGAYAANMAVSECDLLISIGTRFNDRITSKLDEFASNASVIHIDIDAASISKNVRADIPIVADAREAVTALLEYAQFADRTEWIEKIRLDQQQHPMEMIKHGGISPQNIIGQITALCDKPIVVTDVGQHQMWVTQFLEMERGTQLLTSGGLGGMGYGFPAALGAQLGNPGSTVFCISGDGGMQMNIQELATAVVYELPIIICVFNNSYLGMVRQWQQLFFDQRYSSTCLCKRKSCSSTCKGPGDSCPKYTPDFIGLAESYDALGIRIEKEEEIIPALKRAMANKKGPTLLEFIIDTEDLVLPMVKGGNPLTEMLEC